MDELIFNRAATAIVQSHRQLLKARDGAQLALEILRQHIADEHVSEDLTRRVEAYLSDLEAMERTAKGVWRGDSGSSEPDIVVVPDGEGEGRPSLAVGIER